MILEKKWAKATALALSFPSTIFITGLFFKTMVDENILSKKIATLLFLLIVVNTLMLIVIYGYRRKRKNGNNKKN